MKIYQVDAFTDKIFSGNPAGVCVLENTRDNEWMQNVAKEMNLSETAFLVRQKRGFNLRWFTPKREVDLCGHATLASAHILWETRQAEEGEKLEFFTKSGLLTAEKSGEIIELNFPAEEDKQAKPPKELIDGLKFKPKYVGKNRMDYIVEADCEEIVKNLEPNMNALKKVKTRGVIVTAISSSPEYDFVSRFFAPAYGIDEDPVTGSAHCCLGPFWKRRLGKDFFKAYQASERSGYLTVRVNKDRVYIGGKAVMVFCAEMKD